MKENLDKNNEVNKEISDDTTKPNSEIKWGLGGEGHWVCKTLEKRIGKTLKTFWKNINM